MITQDEAIEIAKKAIKGSITPQQNAPIEVELKNDQYIVVFVCIWPPGTRGPDFSARVTIDAHSGRVLEILAGAD